MAKQTWKFPNAPRQPAHPHSVISVFVIRSLDSEISTNPTSIRYLTFVYCNVEL